MEEIAERWIYKIVNFSYWRFDAKTTWCQNDLMPKRFHKNCNLRLIARIDIFALHWFVSCTPFSLGISYAHTKLCTTDEPM